MTDGRDAVGTIDLVDGVWVAADADGTVVGKFGTLRAAARALPRGAPC